ncbi:MAG: pentapeptide repeat-containing protein [Deltaproteobacteria bacterium]|nr:pentapeptide repeat-containing protein [Deltaproteobacteria bacterium]
MSPPAGAAMTADPLRADCSRCAGLCCVAPTFAASADFAIHKPAGRPCPNLGEGFRCTIHDHLRARGFPGCVAFDCFGAGQQVTQITFGGRDWRQEPAIAASMFAAFDATRQLHALRWYLRAALPLADAPLRAELLAAQEPLERHRSAEALASLDLTEARHAAHLLLLRASAQARAPHQGPDRTGADLIGKRLRRAKLGGAQLMGALLLGADLREADLSGADLRGADLRGADLSGADLTGAIFLTQAQLEGARGSAQTRLPPPLARPAHWASAR